MKFFAFLKIASACVGGLSGSGCPVKYLFCADGEKQPFTTKLVNDECVFIDSYDSIIDQLKQLVYTDYYREL